jgi:hypothetical protein
MDNNQTKILLKVKVEEIKAAETKLDNATKTLDKTENEE